MRRLEGVELAQHVQLKGVKQQRQQHEQRRRRLQEQEEGGAVGRSVAFCAARGRRARHNTTFYALRRGGRPCLLR